jgi:Ca-activated chloride channel family protein
LGIAVIISALYALFYLLKQAFFNLQKRRTLVTDSNMNNASGGKK